MPSGLSPPSDPFGWVGRVLEGRYRIDEVVGEGGFGVVYAGHHLGFDEPVAIKCLKLGQNVDPTRRERFLANFIAEGKILYKLSQASPSIVRAIDVGAAVAPGGAWTPYLVLEWVRGITLEAELLDRTIRVLGGRSVHEAITLLEPVARALETAHALGVAHRDVKPGNFILTTRVDGTPTLKVLDFGVAKVMSAAKTSNRKARSLHAFTPTYAAPEQFEPERGETGPWTDVYGLALVVVEVIAGRRAYAGKGTTEIFLEATDPARRPTLRTIGCAASDELERVLARALAVDPRNRQKGAGEFWAELVAAAASEPRTVDVRGVTSADDPDSAPDTVPQTQPDTVAPGGDTFTGGSSSPQIVDRPEPVGRSASTRTVVRSRRTRRPAVVAVLVAMVATISVVVLERDRVFLMVSNESLSPSSSSPSPPAPATAPSLPAALASPPSTGSMAKALPTSSAAQRMTSASSAGTSRTLPVCPSKTCEQIRAERGSACIKANELDNCGRALSGCGCGPSEQCTNKGCEACLNCTSLNWQCGSDKNACGLTLQCGGCASGQVCNDLHRCVAPAAAPPGSNPDVKL